VAGAFVPELQFVENTTVLRIKKDERRTAGRQRPQQQECITTLSYIETKVTHVLTSTPTPKIMKSARQPSQKPCLRKEPHRPPPK
jgi:hypothetical protein